MKASPATRESSAAELRKASSGSARSCGQSRTTVHKILPFEAWARSVWPLKSVDNLRALTGRSRRAVEYQLAGRKPSYSDIVRILRSEHGYSFLQFVMGDARPDWWRGIGKARGLARMRKQVADLQRQLAQAEMDFGGDQ